MQTGRPVPELVARGKNEPRWKDGFDDGLRGVALALRAGVALDCATGLCNILVARRRRVNKRAT